MEINKYFHYSIIIYCCLLYSFYSLNKWHIRIQLLTYWVQVALNELVMLMLNIGKKRGGIKILCKMNVVAYSRWLELFNWMIAKAKKTGKVFWMGLILSLVQVRLAWNHFAQDWCTTLKRTSHGVPCLAAHTIESLFILYITAPRP